MDKLMVDKIKAIADKTRLKIIEILLTKRYCVNVLAEELNISESAVSQHLKILREADLVIGEKRGYYVHYSVKKDKLIEIATAIETLAAGESGRCDGGDKNENN